MGDETTSAIQAPTHVVTCFVLRDVAGTDELLLVRRSDKVRTYRGAWAGISGYLEASVTPLEQAYTELREEAALTANDVTLLREGELLPVEDAANGLAWVVHPFLFRLRPGATLTTDWEATAHQWVRPDVLSQLQTVPRLADALDAVYPAQERRG